MAQRRVGIRARLVVAVAALVSAGSVTACSNGVEAGTLDPPSGTAVHEDVGELAVRNAVIVAGEDGTLTVSLTVVNTGSTEDSLTDVEITADLEPATAVLSPGTIALPPRMATVIPGEGESTIEVDLDVAPGGYLPVTMQFENAGSVDLSLAVVSEASSYGSGTG
ncbi:MAG: hypothetical protein M3455_07685 [Actinomycetota bacterium]|nr:hypothetical protein [Actinomycetota bacterium]